MVARLSIEREEDSTTGTVSYLDVPICKLPLDVAKVRKIADTADLALKTCVSHCLNLDAIFAEKFRCKMGYRFTLYRAVVIARSWNRKSVIGIQETAGQHIYTSFTLAEDLQPAMQIPESKIWRRESTYLTVVGHAEGEKTEEMVKIIFRQSPITLRELAAGMADLNNRIR